MVVRMAMSYTTIIINAWMITSVLITHVVLVVTASTLLVATDVGVLMGTSLTIN